MLQTQFILWSTRTRKACLPRATVLSARSSSSPCSSHSLCAVSSLPFPNHNPHEIPPQEVSLIALPLCVSQLLLVIIYCQLLEGEEVHSLSMSVLSSFSLIVHPSIHPSIHPASQLSTCHLSTHPSIHPSIHPPTQPAVYLSSIYSSIHLSLCSSIHPSNSPSFYFQFIHSSMYLSSIYSFIHPFTYLSVHSAIHPLSIHPTVCVSVYLSIYWKHL